MVWQPKKLCNDCLKLSICKEGRIEKEACTNYKSCKNLVNLSKSGSNVRIKGEIHNMKCMRCGKEMRNTIDGCYICDNCGSRINDCLLRYDTKESNNIPNPPTIANNINLPELNLWGNQGWICPKCGASLSPSTSFCPFCAPTRESTTLYTNKTSER